MFLSGIAYAQDSDHDYERHEYEEEEEEEGRENGAAAALLYAQQMIYGYKTEGENETPKSREVYFYGMRSYPFGKIPQNARLNALGQMEKMQTVSDAPSPLADASWKPIGPFDVGGRVRSIAVHPTDGKTLWIGAADGGVWKSSDRGASWIPLMDNTNAISMGAVAVDPNNPDILFAGTGEMSSNIDAYTGAGIFKSLDGGLTWRVLGLTNVGAFSRIVVNPANSNIVWAAATKNNGGFYKSEDGGVTWRRILDVGVADITVNPQNPNQLWLGMLSTGVRESIDGGETFVERNDGLGRHGSEINRVSIQAAPSNPTIVYALAYEVHGDTTFSRIYKSTNSGHNWRLIFNSRFDFLANSGGSQGWYNNVLAVKPDDPNIVVAGGVTMIRITDGDSTWSFAGRDVHADHHAMAFDPTDPNRFYNGNDGGMYRSDDGGSSFVKISKGLAISQFYAMAIDQGKEDLTYGGTQDNGILTQASIFSGDIASGDGFHVAPDPQETNYLYVEREYGEIYRLDGMGAGGFNITGSMPVGPGYAAWSAPMVLDPKDPLRLYSGRHKLYVNTNARNDNEWEAISPEMPGLISAIGISSFNSEVIYIGSGRGHVLRTTDRGESWTDLTRDHGLPNRAVTDVAFSPTDSNIAYISYSGFFTEHVYKTTDAGNSWQSIGRGLPDIPINALAVHPDDGDIIFAGSDIGMFLSPDGGKTWTVYNEGFPRAVVADLEIHRGLKKLRAATHGRSMFEIGIGGEKPAGLPSITSPSGGEIWTGTKPNVIAWGGFNDPQGVRLEYSLDDGRHWRILGEKIAGTSFRWNTVNAASIVARVRVTGMSDSAQRGISNTFTIREFSPGTVLQAEAKPGVAYGIAFDGEFLWATDFNGNELSKLDPTTLRTIERVQIRGDQGEALDSLFTDITYYPPHSTFFVHKLDTSLPPRSGGVLLEVEKDGDVIGTWRSPCNYPIGLTWLGTKNPSTPFLAASDLDGSQEIYFHDPENPENIPLVYHPATVVQNGPRGLAADSGAFWQVLTEFNGTTVQRSQARRLALGDSQLVDPSCPLPLYSPIGTVINARGIELDDNDKGVWITDFEGNIYKIASC